MTTMNGQQNLTDYTNCFEFSVQKNLTITVLSDSELGGSF